jgi:predicted phage terminase large subunit-like protein
VKALTPYQVACQLLLNPIVASEQSFDVTDLRYYHNEDVYPNLGYYNRYILVDPANSKNRRNDFTVMLVVGLGKDKNYYIIDAYRDKLDIFERAELLSELHKKYHPLRTGYEKYSMQVDVDYIKEYNDKNNYRFEVTPLAGTMNKIDRISKLGALFKENRIYIPKPDSISHIRKFDKKPYLPIREFIDELSTFPLSLHDDMLDALSRVLADEMNVRFPGEGNTRPGYKVTKFKEYNILGLR